MTEDFGTKLAKLRKRQYGDLLFSAVCPSCGELVATDESIQIHANGDYFKQPNATCSKCGRVEMPFYGSMVKKS